MVSLAPGLASAPPSMVPRSPGPSLAAWSASPQWLSCSPRACAKSPLWFLPAAPAWRCRPSAACRAGCVSPGPQGGSGTVSFPVLFNPPMFPFCTWRNHQPQNTRQLLEEAAGPSTDLSCLPPPPSAIKRSSVVCKDSTLFLEHPPMARISQPQHACHLGLERSLMAHYSGHYGALSSLASPATTHQMPAEVFLPPSHFNNQK